MSLGKTSIERLHHFQCYKCHKWWSIGDACIELYNTERRLITERDWFCPWCGIKQQVMDITPTIRDY